MMFDRPGRLWLAAICICSGIAGAQTQQTSPLQQQQKKEETKPPQKTGNPFEPVPQLPAAQSQEQQKAQQAKPVFETPKPQQAKPAFETPQQAKPAFEAPKPAAPKPAGAKDIVEAIEFRGARRVPVDTLRATIFTKRGDKYDPEMLRRDFMALWNTGRFDDITLEEEPGKEGVVLRFVLVERQVVRSIKYENIHSVTVSEILDRFKERRVGLSVESQYDPNKVQRAVVVLKDFLAERGRQYAEVTPEIRQVPPSSLEVTFMVNEGPKVKVGNIDIAGNKVFSDRAVIRSMRALKPYGIPHSILFENIFAKTYDLSKLEMDKEGIRNFYQERGYFMARPLDQTVTLRKTGGTGRFHLPLIYSNKPGIRADITLPVEEGGQYRIRNFNYVGMKVIKVPESLTVPFFQMGPGDVFEIGKFRKGIERLRDQYGVFGYVDFVPDPDIQPVPGTNQLDVIFNVEEGKQFFVRRIDFQGNTTTRDKVIRRELMIDEGDLFNSKLWEASIMRLNQLGYFEALKKEDAATITRDPKTDTVDITLKVKERGKNTVGLTGGVSGIAGSFIGFNYATNNFLGLGETLSVDSQMGDRLRNVTFGFTEPYFLDRPIQLGFTVFTQRFNYDQGREVSLFSGRNLIPFFEAMGKENLMNYESNSYGFTTFLSYPLRRSFARLGLSYGYSTSSYKTLTQAAKTSFDYMNFRGLSGPNTLMGIKTSQITPSYSYNSVDHPMTPTRGHSLSISTGFAGSFLGGNVNMVQPTFDFRYYHPALKKNHVIGIRLMGAFITGFSGKQAPPFNRWYIGGENDVRGFEIWGISPVAYMPSETVVPVLNDDGSKRYQKVLVNGVETYSEVPQRVPMYQMFQPGGDLQTVANFEYRIPLAGPVTLAAFFDAGINKIVRPDQLTVTPTRLQELNGMFPQAGFNGRVKIAPGTQRIRTSTGLELQVLLPVVNAPFRIYWAYNPTIVQTYLQPPVVADRSYFPNQATFINALTDPRVGIGRGVGFNELRKTFRFTIGRTF